MIPPLLLQLRIEQNGRKRLRLWLPLFLLWIPLALILALLSPLIVVVLLVLTVTARGRIFVRSLPRLYSIACALRGLEVDVAAKNSGVFVRIR